VSANAQPVASSAAGIHAQIKNATLFKQAACRGWGAHCRPGLVWRCVPFVGCACVPCWLGICFDLDELCSSGSPVGALLRAACGWWHNHVGQNSTRWMSAGLKRTCRVEFV